MLNNSYRVIVGALPVINAGCVLENSLLISLCSLMINFVKIVS